jgi:hypothetical protein
VATWRETITIDEVYILRGWLRCGCRVVKLPDD